MKRRPLALAAWFAAVSVPAVLLVPAATAQVQQQGAATKLDPSSKVAEALTAFAAAMDYTNNLFPLRARSEGAKALAADPGFGLARVLVAQASPDMPAADRAAEFDRGVADASRGSAGEFLYAAAIRSNTAGRTAEAHTLAGAASTLLPEDPYIAYFHALTSPAAQVQDAVKDITRRFPEFGPAYNTLAYNLNTAGDRNGAMMMVQTYVRLAPNQPNPHDSFAELLQFAGRYQDALGHYAAAARMDSAFDQAYAGMGEAHLLLGHGDAARASYAIAIERAPTNGARINSRAARASTWILEGKSKDALKELATIAADAEQQKLTANATGLYRAMALIEAAFGDKTAAGADLAKAATLGGADVAPQVRFAGIVAALTGDLAGAKAAADKFRATAAAGTAAQQSQSHELDAIVAVASKDLATAQAELAKAGGTPNLGRALVAEALKKGGRKADADPLVAAIASSGTVTTLDLIARAKIAKM